MDVIEIHNLVKKYGNKTAVDDLNLNIEKGKIYGFLGPNGAGKSTTMNIITGYIGATEGTVSIDGHDIFKEPEKAKESIGYLPEMPPLYPEMTVKEYLKFVAELKKIPKKDREASINESMEKTKTLDVKNRLIKNLSKGYKQRVGIAQALLGMPEVIILDEPTVGLDPNQIIEIRRLIKELGSQHTVILSSHILTEISEVCDYIFIIANGKLVASGTEQELFDNVSDSKTLHVEIKGNKDKVQTIIENIQDSTNFSFSDGENEQLVSVNISVKKGSDIREELFFACAQEKMPIYDMRFENVGLENVFITLTNENKKENDNSDELEFDEELEEQEVE